MSTPAPDDVDPGRLASLLSLNNDSGGGVRWRAEEFAAVWRHLLSTPVRAELAGVDAGRADQSASDASGQPTASTATADLTFGQFLHHPRPSPDMLDQLRTFAKEAEDGTGGGLPRDVGRVLYFTSIVAGLLGCGRRLTSLGDDSLRRGVEWCLAQDWVDAQTRGLLAQGLARLGDNAGAGH